MKFLIQKVGKIIPYAYTENIIDLRNFDKNDTCVAIYDNRQYTGTVGEILFLLRLVVEETLERDATIVGDGIREAMLSDVSDLPYSGYDSQAAKMMKVIHGNDKFVDLAKKIIIEK